MQSDFITRLEVSNFGCLNDVKLDLTRLHAFIGPNDSGKSTILRAARVVARMMATRIATTDQRWPDFESGLEPERGPRILARYGDTEFEVKTRDRTYYHSLKVGDLAPARIGSGSPLPRDLLSHSPGELRQAFEADPDLRRVLGGDARLVRLDPDALRGASELIPEGDKIRLHDERGQGLPGVYDAILSRGDESFHRIADDVKKRFATIRNLRLKAVSNSQKIIEVESTSGQRVPAQFMSEGLLYYLGFAAMPYLEPTSLLLVEEPENGLHPVRVAEIVDILRELSKRTQVLIATHSPLVVNELQPSEVTIVTRDPHSGTQARRLLDTPNFSERSKVYAPGELWLNYANGIDEAPLLRPDHRLDAE